MLRDLTGIFCGFHLSWLASGFSPPPRHTFAPHVMHVNISFSANADLACTVTVRAPRPTPP